MIETIIGIAAGLIITLIGWSLNRNVINLDNKIKEIMTETSKNSLDVSEVKENYLGRFEEVKDLINTQSQVLDQRFLDLHVSVARVEEQVKTLFKQGV